MPRKPEVHPLVLLLSFLKGKKSGTSIASLVNAATIDLTHRLLLAEDYLNLAGQLSNASDVINILDFFLYLLRNGHLAKLDANGRARRLMMKIIKTTPVMPRSLFVTGIKMKDKREYVGGGGFGHVFKARLGGEVVAMKLLYRTHNNVDFCREAIMWQSLKHKFVLPFLGIYETESATQFFLVSPYMKNGTLSQWRKDGNPSAADIQERILEVAQGLLYIHSENVVHGDLRGDNILLDANFHAQIADFGLTRHSEATITRTGSLHYNFAAPELFGFFEGDGYGSDDDEKLMARTQRSDVYAFGCLYYEIHHDVMPFEGLKEVQIMRLISQGDRPPRREEPPLNDWEWQLIQSCWVAEAAKRPTMEDITEGMKITAPAMQRDADSSSLSLLLSILRQNLPRSLITSVVNTTTIELMRLVLSNDDCANVSPMLTHASDVDNLMEFTLHILRHRSLLTSDPKMDVNRRARRLMSKIITKMPVLPRSLRPSGIVRLADRDPFKGVLDGSPVSLKLLSKRRLNNFSICEKALMWRSLHHDFVLPFLGIYEDGSASQSFLVTPSMVNGTLTQWRRRTNPPASEVQKRLLEVAQGIHYIHSEGVVHGSLRGDNILLDAELHVQIADFGFTRHSEAANTQLRAQYCSFLAPELFKYSDGEVYDSDDATQEADIYAFGSLYYEVHYDIVPFAGSTEIQILVFVSRGVYPPRFIDPPLSDDEWGLIRHCWAKDKSQRPEIQDVLKSMYGWKQVNKGSNSLKRRGAVHYRSSSQAGSIGSRPFSVISHAG